MIHHKIIDLLAETSFLCSPQRHKISSPQVINVFRLQSSEAFLNMKRFIFKKKGKIHKVLDWNLL